MQLFNFNDTALFKSLEVVARRTIFAVERYPVAYYLWLQTFSLQVSVELFGVYDHLHGHTVLLILTIVTTYSGDDRIHAVKMFSNENFFFALYIASILTQLIAVK